MEFQKKMKLRKTIAVSYLILGFSLVIADLLTGSENYFLFHFGVALLTMGCLRLHRNRKITASEETMRKQELSEKDERIRMITERARSWAFSLSVTGSGILVIVLNILGYQEQALPFAWYVCGMVILYWICWLILNKKY